MEIVLEGAEGVPEGGVLSIKVGETKRQAPVSKVGQPFRFASSPTEPFPLSVELLMPAAPVQSVSIDPAKPHFEVDFGKSMKVKLHQREVLELQRPVADIEGAAQARGMPADKLQMAQKAASYLEEHDLVRTFQDILHGLLVNKPADPHTYVEERIARSKRLAASKKPQQTSGQNSARSGMEASTIGSDASAGRSRGRKSVRETMRMSRMSTRGTLASRTKVDTLFLTLQSAHDNLPIVLPLLPKELREMLMSEDLTEECKRQFKALDTKNKGELNPSDLLEVLVGLTNANKTSIGTDQARRFCEMFDSNEDGKICLDEFTALVQFVIVAGFLESSEGQEVVQTAMVEESNFVEFMAIIEQDKERLWTIIPFLPNWLVEHVTGEEFQTAALEQFKTLDADNSGSLEPHELLPVVASLSEAHPLIIDVEKCRQFTMLFDTLGNGVIEREEFVEFAQFLTVMNFLASTEEGRDVTDRADLESNSMRLGRIISTLYRDPKALADAIHSLPQVLVSEVTGEDFEKFFANGFTALDKDKKDAMDPALLFTLIISFSKKHPFALTLDQCVQYWGIFNVDGKGTISKAELSIFARYSIVLAYLHFAKDHEDMYVQELLLGRDQIKDLLQSIKSGLGKVKDLVPYLPQELITELSSDTFEVACAKEFGSLDVDRSGVLEPKELLPLIIRMSEVHHFALTEEHCLHFVDIFDVERNGVITRAEYANLVRFMLIIAFMETEAGHLARFDMEADQIATGHSAVEELLHIMEQDRHAVTKVMPLLPREIFDDLSSDDFVMQCHDRFVMLDNDSSGSLSPDQLFPVIVELSKAHPYAITFEQCKRFTGIFDLEGNGVLKPHEFLDFTRFLYVMSYLHSPAGKEAATDALKVMNDSKRIEDLIASMARDKHNYTKVLPHLPTWLTEDLLSENFTAECLAHFRGLDRDKSGSLDPEELFPMVLKLAGAHHMSLDMDQCKRFTRIFDTAGTGVISKGEFVEFSRFLIILGFLNSPDGQALIKKADEVTNSSQRQDKALPSSGAPAAPEHMAVDLDFYKNKADKLASENDELRDKMHSLERCVRRMESRMEEQDIRLRHAEVDLRTSGTMRH